MLLEWGLLRPLSIALWLGILPRKSNTDSEISTGIDASAAGLQLYKKLGWKECGEVVIDMEEWGGIAKKERVVQLIRKPKAQHA